MRLLVRHLPAFLTLLVPLALLAWLGGGELSRLEVRADQLLQDQAQRFLAETARRINDEIDTTSDRLLGNLPDLGLLRLVHAAQQLRDADRRVLDLCVIDAEGHLAFPRVSRDPLDGLPYHWNSPAAEVRRAEALEAFGDLDGARLELEGFLEQRGNRRGQRVGREDVTVRARFTLARVLRNQGQLDLAAERYRRIVIDTRPRPGTGRDPSRAQVTDAAVGVLAELALAELDIQRGRSGRRAAELMRDIAAGMHDDVADALLVEVLAACDAGIALGSPLREIADQAVRTDTIRRSGRAFAADYQSFLQQSVARKIRHVESRTRLLHAYAGADHASLIALRPMTDRESQDSLEFIGDADWIGVRLDLDQILDTAVGGSRRERGSGFRLLLADVDGVPLSAPNPAASGEPLATIATVGGIQLAATPIDPSALVTERSRANRVRAILLVALCLTAAAGAFLLVRSVAREAEFADARLRFVSQVSHELRTPLSLIKMYGETLALGRSESMEQSARFAGIITREADHLTSLVDRVMQLSSAGETDDSGRRVTQPLAPIITRVANDYLPSLAAEGIALRVDLRGSPTAAVDAARLESALVAVLENSAKYRDGQRGPQQIELSACRVGDEVRIEIADRGIGIPASERERVFDSFYRGTNIGARRGAGLGLHLVRRFAEAHDGIAEALPRDGGGTIVRISLPACGESAADAEDQHPGDRGRARSS